MRRPTGRNHLIIAGSNKSGTTALFRYLGDHPTVALSKYKELGFFLKPVEDRPDIDLATYETQFLDNSNARLLVEATPQYLHGGSRSAARIKAVVPDALLLFILRNPTDRVLSYYRSSAGQHGLPTFGIGPDQFVSEALEAMQVGDSDVGQLPYRQRAFRQELHISCYAKFLDAFVDVFGPGNVLITFFDDLSTSPGELVNEICAFADIDPGHYDDFVFRVENQTRMHRSTSLQKISGALNSQLEPLLNRFPVLRRSARNLYDRINVRPSLDIAMPEESKQQLDEFFAPWNEQLASWMAATYPEKRLPGWLKG